MEDSNVNYTTRRYQFTREITSVGEDMEKSEPPCTADWNVKWCSCFLGFTVLQKVKDRHITIRPRNFTSRKCMSTQNCTYIPAALFILAKKWKKPKCPLTNEWISKMWYSRTMNYYLLIKEMKH